MRRLERFASLFAVSLGVVGVVTVFATSCEKVQADTWGGSGPIIWNGTNAYDMSSGGIKTGKLVLPELAVTGAESWTIQAPSMAADQTMTLPNAGASAGDVWLIDASEVVSFGKIVNANIDAAAAIVGTKIASATDLVSGVVTTAAQSFSGLKTFYDGVRLDDDVNQTTLAYYREDGGSAALSSACGTTATVAWTATRTGRSVDLSFVITIAGTGQSANDCTATAIIPAWARPTTNPPWTASFPVDFGNNIYASAQIQTNGNVLFTQRDLDTGARAIWATATQPAPITMTYPNTL